MKTIERIIEAIIFNSRWLMAPFYLGLIIGLVMLFITFCVRLFELVFHLRGASDSDIIIALLELVDVCLTGNLLLIVIFSGYENFVSRIDPGHHPDWPEWMTKIDFGGLKQKLLSSIVAISAIQVLKAFMNIDKYSDMSRLGWLVGIHLVFVVSTLILALSDRLSEPSEIKPEHERPNK